MCSARWGRFLDCYFQLPKKSVWCLHSQQAVTLVPGTFVHPATAAGLSSSPVPQVFPAALAGWCVLLFPSAHLGPASLSTFSPFVKDPLRVGLGECGERRDKEARV